MGLINCLKGPFGGVCPIRLLAPEESESYAEAALITHIMVLDS